MIKMTTLISFLFSVLCHAGPMKDFKEEEKQFKALRDSFLKEKGLCPTAEAKRKNLWAAYSKLDTKINGVLLHLAEGEKN